jgi:hypothetical protein
MGGAYSVSEGRLQIRTTFWLKSLKRRNHWEDLDEDGMITLKRFMGE